MPANADPCLTPSDLNRQVRQLLESHYDFVWVEGEISNFARPSSGHWYFTLKDDRAQVRCAMFRNRNQRIRQLPENGDAVRLRARVSLYEGRGEFQLIGEFLEPAGAGALRARFEALRDQLAAEGLFDQARKKPLPTAVRHLAVISSPTGAALQDILQVLARRNPAIEVSVLPTPVQGEDAPPGLRAAIARANSLARDRHRYPFDAIILARGGGSLEDLWAFNDEGLARAIAASELPVVTGVGHETDITIADFAADVRAPTPSAAAELLSEDREALLETLAGLQARLRLATGRQLERGGHILERLRGRLQHPGARLREQSQRLDGQELQLRAAIRGRLQREAQTVSHLQQRLRTVSPERRLQRADAELSLLRARLAGAVANLLAKRRAGLSLQAQLLESLNPLSILQRGYAVVSDSRGRALLRSAQASPGDRLQARLAEGILDLEVIEARRDKS